MRFRFVLQNRYAKGENDMEFTGEELCAENTASKVPCEIYSRVVGYLRPVQNWNEGKKQEFADRKSFAVTPVLGQAATEADQQLATGS